MKNAMRIDIIVLRKTIKQTLAILLIVGVCVGYGMSSLSSASAMIAACAPYFFVLTAFSTDAVQGWDRYRSMMPLTRKDIVGGRYLGQLVLSLCTTVFAFLVGIAAMAIGMVCGLAAPANVLDNVVEIIASAFAAFAIVMILLSIVMPICFKSGLTRAGMILPAVMVVLFVAVPTLIGDMFGGIDMSAIENMLAALDSPQAILISTVAMLAIMAVAYFSSYKASCKLYAVRDL